MKRRWTIRQLLLGVNLFVLLVPLGAIVFLQVFDAYLLRRTERQLIAESVVIGEAWRDRLLDLLGTPPEATPSIRPTGRLHDTFVPHRPQINLGYEVSSTDPSPPARHPGARDDPASRAAALVEPLLARVQVFNLSGVRLLDESGCVVASSGADRDKCLDHLEEVREALAGRYSAVVRRRQGSARLLRLNSIRRRGNLRVFTATPLLMDGAVLGVVRMSRTAVSPIELLWAHRGKVALLLGIVLLVTPVSSYLFSHAISKPVRTLTREVESMTRGESAGRFVPGRLAPREVQVLAAALDRMTTQLSEQSGYILDFAGNASHELKGPLTGITGAVELLQDGWEGMSDDQRQRFLDNIAADAARMQHLVTDLLHLARLESSPEEEAQGVELASFLREFAEPYGEAVRLDLAQAPERMWITRDRLEMALRNLVDNAIRHRAGHPVDVAVTAEGDRVVFTVRDRGSGIAAADRERVFDRFFTTRGEEGGTGLGLSIVEAVASARDGNVDFETGPQGTTFRLVL